MWLLDAPLTVPDPRQRCSPAASMTSTSSVAVSGWADSETNEVQNKSAADDSSDSATEI